MTPLWTAQPTATPTFFQVVEAAFCGQTTVLKGRSVQKTSKTAKILFLHAETTKRELTKIFFLAWQWWWYFLIELSRYQRKLCVWQKWLSDIVSCTLEKWGTIWRESFEFRKQPLLLASFCTNFGYKTRMGAYLSQLLFAYIGNLFLRCNGKESSFTS